MAQNEHPSFQNRFDRHLEAAKRVEKRTKRTERRAAAVVVLFIAVLLCSILLGFTLVIAAIAFLISNS